MNAAVTIALIELLLRVGPPAFIALMKAFDKDNPSVEDIRSLMVKAPEEYIK